MSVLDLIKKPFSNGRAASKGSEKNQAEVHHPYLDGRYHLDRALQSLAHDRDRWRAIAWLMSILLAVALVAHAGSWLFMRPRVYVAQVDQLGAVRFLEPVEKEKFSPELQSLLLANVVQLMRTLPEDDFLLREYIRQALSYLSGQAAKTYQEEASQTLNDRLTRRYVERIVSIKQTEANVFRALWYETEIKQGVRERYAREGVFRVTFAQPPQEVLLRNPIGFFIVSYQINTLNAK